MSIFRKKSVLERRLSKISAEKKHGGEKIGGEIGLISALTPVKKKALHGIHRQKSQLVNSDSGSRGGGSSLLGSSTYLEPNDELLYAGG